MSVFNDTLCKDCTCIPGCAKLGHRFNPPVCRITSRVQDSQFYIVHCTDKYLHISRNYGYDCGHDGSPAHMRARHKLFIAWLHNSYNAYICVLYLRWPLMHFSQLWPSGWSMRLSDMKCTLMIWRAWIWTRLGELGVSSTSVISRTWNKNKNHTFLLWLPAHAIHTYSSYDAAGCLQAKSNYLIKND